MKSFLGLCTMWWIIKRADDTGCNYIVSLCLCCLAAQQPLRLGSVATKRQTQTLVPRAVTRSFLLTFFFYLVVLVPTVCWKHIDQCGQHNKSRVFMCMVFLLFFLFFQKRKRTNEDTSSFWIHAMSISTKITPKCSLLLHSWIQIWWLSPASSSNCL